MSFSIRHSFKLLAFVLIILCTSCGENMDIFIPDPPTGTTEDIFNSLANTSEAFMVDADQEIIFETKAGSVFQFPQDIFVNGDGNIINGDIQIIVKEIDEKSEMIANQLTTLTDSKLLISERMFLVTANKDDVVLKIKDGKSYKIHVPNSLPEENMRLFYGEESDLGIIWDESTNREDLVINEWFFQVPNGVLTDFGYVLNASKLDWINIDKYSETPEDQQVDIVVQLPEDLYNHENTAVFIVFTDENSIARLNYDATRGQFIEPYGVVPQSKNIKLVVLAAMQESIFHFSIKNQTTERNRVFHITPSNATKEEINKALEAL